MSAIRYRLANALRRNAAIMPAQARFPTPARLVGQQPQWKHSRTVVQPHVRWTSSQSKPPASTAAKEPKSILDQAIAVTGDAATSFTKGATESVQWAASAKGRESASQAAASIARTTSEAASYVASAPATKAATKATTETASWVATMVGRAAHQAGTGAVEAANATMWSFLGRMAGFAIVLVMAGGFAYGLGTSLPKVLASSISIGGLTKRDPDAPSVADKAGETSAAVINSAKQAWSRAKGAIGAIGAGSTATTTSDDAAADTAPPSGGGLRQNARARWEAAKNKVKTAIDKVDPRNSSKD